MKKPKATQRSRSAQSVPTVAKISPRQANGGGRATAGGVVFQSIVGACAASALLAGCPSSRIASGLPGLPKKVRFETPSAVDDLTIETDTGNLYVQAKRTIPLSSKDNSELASVAAQFVRQYQQGAEEISSRRSLHPAQDRLVLAVSDQAAGTVKDDLREVLDRRRTGAQTGLPTHLQNALTIFSAHIDREWSAIFGKTITGTDRQSILSLCCVIVIGDSQRQVAEEALRNVVASPGDESGLFDVLISWAANAAQQGVGGDATAIRIALIGKARLVEPPNYRDDVKRLKFYSDGTLDRLERFTTIEAPEGPIVITRPVVDLIVRAAPEGALALTGEPGAGKSAVLREVALRLSKSATVVVLAVDASAVSLDALRLSIGLKHQLIDVLAQMSGEKPAYLLLDALDAVRGGTAEATYKRLVELVGDLVGWHIIASVRTFDLRLGREWKRLFKGTPPETSHLDQNFIDVRHVHIAPLDAGEQADIEAKSPTLTAAIAVGGSKMESLANNPFNLALLADLLRGGISASSLADIATRGELLDRYWDHRISDLGTAATAGLRCIVLWMINRRSVEIPEALVPVPTAPVVDELQRAGVLVAEKTRRIGFRHHVLFDYAVARLALLPDREEALTYLTRTTGAGLLISPSLGYWLEELKKNLTPSSYWPFIVAVITNEDTDPIVRVEVARIAVETVTETEDLTPLAAALTTTDTSKERAFQHLAGSLIMKGYRKSPISVRPWASLLAKVTAPNAAQIGSVVDLISLFLENASDAEALNNLGIAARTLFDIISANDNWMPRLRRDAISFVAETFGSDTKASSQRLNQIFEPERFAKFGHIEVPALADKVMHLAPFDEELVICLFGCAFRGSEFSHNQTTSLSNSWILPLTSNAAQDFNMAGYSLSRDFPKLLHAFPRVALRALSISILSERDREHARSDKPVFETIQIAGEGRLFEKDGSYIWAWNIDEDEHDNLAKLYRATMTWIDSITDHDLLYAIPSLILCESGTALAWRTVLDLARLCPQILGVSIWPTPSSKHLLCSPDTQASAIAAVAAIYPHLSDVDHERAEVEWLALDFSESSSPEELRKKILGTLFTAIGESELATEVARSFLRDVTQQGSTYPNKKPFAITVQSKPYALADWLADLDVDTKVPETAALLDLVSALRAILDDCKAEEDPAKIVALWPATQAVQECLSIQKSLRMPVEGEALEALAAGLGRCLSADLVPPDNRAASLARLLSISGHPHPQPSADTEEKFALFQSYGSPAPRVEAAQALSMLTNKAEFWPGIKDRFETMLLHDCHPAVRLQLVNSLPQLRHLDQNEMWRLAKEVAAQENNPAILHSLVARFPFDSPADSDHLETLVLDLSRRLHTYQKRGDDPIVGRITFFAIKQGRSASAAEMVSWFGDIVANEDRLRHALFDIRNAMLIGLDKVDPHLDAIRYRAKNFIMSLIAAIEPEVRSWPLTGREPTPQETAALKLFNEVANQIYYAVGTDKLSATLKGASARTRFLTEYAPLISKLTTLGTPHTIYHLLEVLGTLLPVAPERCFDLMAEAMLRTTGVARYEHESLGAGLFVQLVGRFLADYRSIFDDHIRRNNLIDCIAVFVDSGWPEARHLFQNLPELLQ